MADALEHGQSSRFRKRNTAADVATVEKMIEDLPRLPDTPLPDEWELATPRLLASRGIEYVTYEDWQKLDHLERHEGERAGRIRRKFTDIDSMLDALRTEPGTVP